MKKTILMPLTVVISLFCVFVLSMSCISYANANITAETSFTMCYEPLVSNVGNNLTVEIEEDSYDFNGYDSVNNVDDSTSDYSDYEVVNEPETFDSDVEIEPIEENTKEIVQTIEIPKPTETVEPDIEEIIVSDTPEVITQTEITPEVSTSPIISEPVIVNYISGQLPLYNYAFGTYVGRLTIPSVGVDVAVYHSNSQSTVDAVDSAGAYYAYESQPDYANYTFVIADHNYQGFNAIKSCVIGTEAYITTANGTYSYVCDRIIPNGHNEGYGILDENYNLVYSNEGGMWLQTCNDTWENDTLVHFHTK